MRDLGFNENQKCSECDNLAYFEVDGRCYCGKHFDDWLARQRE